MKYWLLFAACLVAPSLWLGCVPAAPPVPGNPTTTTAAVLSNSSDSIPPAADPTAHPVTDTNPEPTPLAEKTTNVSATKQQTPERIDFDDLNCNIQANLVFRDWMLTPRAKELDGQRVRLGGYMLADLKINGIEEFVLLKNTECKFGPDGQADHLALVKLIGDETANFTDKPVDVIGTLRFKPFTGIDGFTWAIYEIEAEAVRPMRR